MLITVDYTDAFPDELANSEDNNHDEGTGKESDGSRDAGMGADSGTMGNDDQGMAMGGDKGDIDHTGDLNQVYS
ncbi:hypothetical protein DNHGIG_08620 [Collibacillus ludicampi]|jgi:hypothetical protein|uniref:Uncharacterized protein n=1 Tax=Collibacillus ludicampi TaxID=2771369 RepID=A0AAV4LCD2_9BACL|nr:hypothetical protein [Collibacillus ludicampi]GIM45313.1 hypothetical protein DNHGIG_08620 [Collibacillus ludicampi]